MSGDAGSVDDCATAVLEHDGDFVPHRIEHSPHVNIENPSIFGFGRMIERAFPLNACIVKRHVKPAEFVDCEIDHLFDVCIF